MSINLLLYKTNYQRIKKNYQIIQYIKNKNKIIKECRFI
jgi:hypothetical protein